MHVVCLLTFLREVWETLMTFNTLLLVSTNTYSLLNTFSDLERPSYL